MMPLTTDTAELLDLVVVLDLAALLEDLLVIT